MLSQNEYHESLTRCGLDHSKFVDMQQSLARNIIVKKIADEFELVFTFRATCTKFSDFLYRDHVELCVLEKEVFVLYLSTVAQWKAVNKFGRSKYILHAKG